MNGRPSQGIRRSCRWSDSQKVQPSGKSATSRMVSDARAGPAPRRAAPPARSSPRPRISAGQSGRSGAESDPVQQRAASRPAARARAAAGVGLSGERAMQVDLQDLRELVVHRGNRPGHRILDDLAAPVAGGTASARANRARHRAPAGWGTGPPLGPAPASAPGG